jgi:hypothetical protein
VTSQWFSGTPVSSTNKTDRHDITEILLEVVLNILNQTNDICCGIFFFFRMIIQRVNIRFVDIGGIVSDHHCLNFLL